MIFGEICEACEHAHTSDTAYRCDYFDADGTPCGCPVGP